MYDTELEHSKAEATETSQKLNTEKRKLEEKLEEVEKVCLILSLNLANLVQSLYFWLRYRYFTPTLLIQIHTSSSSLQ